MEGHRIFATFVVTWVVVTAGTQEILLSFYSNIDLAMESWVF